MECILLAGAPMPVAFMSHGAGPWPYAGMANTLGVSSAEKASMTASLQAQGQHLNQKPKALLVISAHWEEAVPTVMTSAAPPMLFDYYGTSIKAVRRIFLVSRIM